MRKRRASPSQASRARRTARARRTGRARWAPLVVAVLALGAVLASGCAKPAGTQGPAPGPATVLERAAATVPPMQADIAAHVAWWEEFVAGHPKRDLLLPNNAAARQSIADALRGQGYAVEDLAFGVGAPAVPTQPAGPAAVHVVVGRRDGAVMPERAIAIGAHYDTQAGTLQGAYDNGSGTAAALAVCDALRHVELRRTILCLLFDGEEEGALGSLAYVDAVEGELAIDAYLGFDMVGLNYPGKDVGDGTWRLFAWVGARHAESLFPFVNGTLHDVLGHPESGVEAFPFNDRNSDEASFAERGIPTVRYAGGRTAAAYPQYHLPGDTVEFVDEYAGGRDRFVAGFGAAVEAAYTQAVMLDATTLAELEDAYA